MSIRARNAYLATHKEKSRKKGGKTIMQNQIFSTRPVFFWKRCMSFFRQIGSFRFLVGALLMSVGGFSSGCSLVAPIHPKSTECLTCHESRALLLPSHQDLSKDCSTCHQKTKWVRAIPHEKSSLQGKHLKLLCNQCHKNVPHESLPMDCYSCHQKNYEGVINPNHVFGKYSKQCQACHSQEKWTPAFLNHDQFFLLEGAHRNLACEKCHINDRYAGTPKDCYSCHQKNYEGVKNPDHVLRKYPKQCQSCHTQIKWKPAIFDHNQFFALKGAHQKLACEKCHINDRYAGTPKDCYSCHQKNYTGTKNPNHVTAQFPRTCQTCHGESSWKPATFAHDKYFPISQGKHREYEKSCGECHKNTQNYKEFTCTDCHEHNKSNMDREHRDESDYRYESKACFKCHPQGIADD